MDHFDRMLVFLTKESQRYPEGEVPRNMTKVLNLLKSDPLKKKAIMAFAIDHTEGLVTLANFTQTINIPIALALADKLADLETNLKEAVANAKLHPGVDIALSLLKGRVGKHFRENSCPI